MVDYKNKKITIIGSGKTGYSCVKFFLLKEANVCLMDTRSCPPNINLFPKNIKFFLGKLNIEYLLKSDLIIKSPGISINKNEINLIYKKKIEIISDIEVFCREKKSAKIIAITGTNGKTTVSSLIYEILKNNNYSVSIGGNIGYPVLDLLDKEYEFYIFELSSFQLEMTFSLKTIVSSVLNISNDHLDRHLDIEKYRNIKLKIYNNSSYCVINSDNKLSNPRNFFLNREYEFFGIKHGNYHLNFLKNKSIDLMYKNNIILNSSELRISGIHNYLNILSTLAILKNINIDIKNKLSIIKKFSSLKHRFNLILDFNGIKWINDSKSTNLSSTCYALNSINTKNNIHLLLGGIKKSKNFNNLIKYLKKKKIKLYCFGKDGKYINNFFNNFSSIYLNNLESLLIRIFNIAKSGDIVLFSPACSSTDQYKNFEDRGDDFIKLVKKINKIN